MFIKALTTLLLVALVAAVPKPQPDRTSPELAARTMPTTPPNWTPAILASLDDGEHFGAPGQNTWVTRYPPALAVCPNEVNALSACNSDGMSTCEQERVEFEWCLQQMLSWCGGEYVDAVRSCLFEDVAGCKTTLDTLYVCQAQLTSGPVPTTW